MKLRIFDVLRNHHETIKVLNWASDLSNKNDNNGRIQDESYDMLFLPSSDLKAMISGIEVQINSLNDSL